MFKDVWDGASELACDGSVAPAQRRDYFFPALFRRAYSRTQRVRINDSTQDTTAQQGAKEGPFRIESVASQVGQGHGDQREWKRQHQHRLRASAGCGAERLTGVD